jgi:mono/diheme cytochrome c family protein
MRRPCLVAALACVGFGSLVPAPHAAEPGAAQRGEKALLGRHFTMPTISLEAYRTAWRVWDPKAKDAPARYDEAFRERYGLHPAPYPNGGYPMGLREGPGFLGRKAIATDCLICHGGSILGQSYVGMPNSSLDIDQFFREMAQAAGMAGKLPFHFCNVRGTSEAGGMAVWLLGLREPDLKLRSTPLDLGLHDDMCEDAPAWWLLKKKKTMYHTGGGDARSVRSLMQFMMSPLNSADSIKREEQTFADIQAYLLTLQPPRYPFPIDRALAGKGENVFRNNCSRCHGTYGEKWTYPNKIVPIKEIGTDPTRFNGLTEAFGRYYNRSWFAQEKRGWLVDDSPARRSVGYQAPPLDGIWATAPYFHNGSVPTVADVLNSKARPRIFTRSYRTEKEAYDPAKLGWKVKVLERGADPKLPDFEQRKVYDTTKPGRGNGGHTFGDDLTDEQRRAVIEYLKTL